MTIDTFFNKKRVRRAWSVFGVLLVSSFTIFWGFSVFGATSFTDDFEDYPLGALAGNDSWTGGGSVVDTVVQAGIHAITVSQGTYGKKTLDATTTDGYLSFYFRASSNQSYTIFRLYNGGTSLYPIIRAEYNYAFASTSIFYYDGVAYTELSSLVLNTWYQIEVKWRKDLMLGSQMRFQIDKSGWTAWVSSDMTASGLDSFGFAGSYITTPNYSDTLSAEEPLGEFRIWGISPASSTEITATSTEFTFGYEGFATSTWNGILVNFCEETTGICAEEKKYPKSELSGTSGQKTLSFENFNFDANGHWNLIGDAYFGMFSSNWEWVEGYTGNVVSPDYYVMINFEGLPEIFQVEVPETWYTEHTDYATSTAFFSSISGILTPLFSKIGEFGSRISGFFDQNEAFSRGNNIGAILPTFKLYIAQFSFLFGGFPIIETFILAMVVMVGFFLFKLIFRLIRG